MASVSLGSDSKLNWSLGSNGIWTRHALPAPLPPSVPNLVLNTTKAFPTAMGFGRNATGGEGGTIVEVTTLASTGAGSFHEAAETASDNTIIVFNVSGNIVVTDDLDFTADNITIAGETAPGDGIALVSTGNLSAVNGSLWSISGQNYIIRFLRLRRKGEDVGSNPGLGGILGVSGGTGENYILDHLSYSWCVDDLAGFSFNGGDKYTIQNCMFYEGVPATGETAQNIKGVLVYGQVKDLSWIENVMAHIGQRCPSLGTNDQDARMEAINNVLYNIVSFGMTHAVSTGGAGGGSASGSIRSNWVGNKVIEGSDTFTTRYDMGAEGDEDILIYVEDNITRDRPLKTDPEWDCMGDLDTTLTQPLSTSKQSVTPFDFGSYDINNAIDSDDVESIVIPRAGCNISRDVEDARIQTEIGARTGQCYNTGGIISASYPTLTGTPWTYKAGTHIPESFANTHGITSDTQVKTSWDFGTYTVTNNISANAHQMWRWWRAGDFTRLLGL